jgi:hypothetical protein
LIGPLQKNARVFKKKQNAQVLMRPSALGKVVHRKDFISNEDLAEDFALVFGTGLIDDVGSVPTE